MKQITIFELAELIYSLDTNKEIKVCENEDCSDLWGIKSIEVFEGVLILIGYYGSNSGYCISPICSIEVVEEELKYILDKYEQDSKVWILD